MPHPQGAGGDTLSDSACLCIPTRLTSPPVGRRATSIAQAIPRTHVRQRHTAHTLPQRQTAKQPTSTMVWTHEAKETQNVKSSPSSAASPSAPPVRPRSPAFVVRLLYACASDEGALYGAAEVAAREARSRHPLRNRVATIRTSSVVQRPPPTSPAVNASVAGPSFPVPTVASSCAPLRAPRQRPRALSPSVTN